ncbi:MAG: mechanosensitive ion channel, partial [Spirochaetia bacterium]|nr:mechanosensitive ion channel [Spirochaetia bacterium]
KRMFSRRVVMTFSVVYETPIEKLIEIPGILKKAVEGFKDVRFDRAHMNTLNSSSVDFEMVFIVDGNDYNRYMDVRQAVNLTVLEEFEKRKISIAYPTQRVVLDKI